MIKQMSTNLPHVQGDEISQQMEKLGKVINQVTKFVQGCHSPLGNGFTNLCPGIRCGQGLETQLLTSPATVKVAGALPGSTT